MMENTSNSQEDDREVYPFPGKVKSTVWEFFGFYKNKMGFLDKSRAICKLCKRGINYSGNTTNLRTHIVHHHKNVNSSPETSYSRPGLNRHYSENSSIGNIQSYSYNNSTVDSFLHAGTPPRGPRQNYSEEITSPTLHVDSSGAYTSGRNSGHLSNWVTEGGLAAGDNALQENSSGSFPESDAESFSGFMSLKDLVFETVIHDLLPVESVDASRFQKLLGIGRRNPALPTSEVITSLIHTRFSDVQALVLSELASALNKSLKIEFWESDCYRYVTIYVCALFDNWKMKNYVLCTLELADDCESTGIELLQEKLDQFNISGSILVSDGNDLVAKYSDSKNCILLEALCCTIEKTARLCLAEPVTKTLIEKVQKVVQSFRNAGAHAVLIEKQIALNMPPKTLVGCNLKVWTSCLEMMEIMVEQSNAIIAACADSSPSVASIEKLRSAEFAFIQTLINILTPLKTGLLLTKDMKHPTASVVLPVLRKLEMSLANTDTDSQFITELKAKMINSLKESYMNESVKDFLLLSSFLDPRFKGLKFVDQSDQDHTKALLKKSALEMKNQSAAANNADSNSPIKMETIVKIEIDDDYAENSGTIWTGLVDKAEADNEPKAKKMKIENQSEKSADDWFADVILELNDNTAEDSVTVEINRYKCEMQVSSSASPLTWWRDRQKSFPLISEVAKKYVFVPALLGTKDYASEKRFKRQRNAISPNHVEQVTFLHGNFDKIASTYK